MKLDQAGTYTYALYAQRNFNEDMLQSKFCPFCRQFDVDAKDFYYKTDNSGEFERYYTDEEVDQIKSLIQTEKDRKELEKKEAAEARSKLAVYQISAILYLQCGLGILQAALFRDQMTKDGVKVNLIISAIVSIIYCEIIYYTDNSQILLELIRWIYILFEIIIHIKYSKKQQDNIDGAAEQMINLSKESNKQ